MDAAEFQREAMRYQRLLWHISWGMLGNNEDCADAVQDALLNAWQHRDTLRDARSFKPWLARILTNTCADMLRKRMKRTQVAIEDDTAAVEPFADALPLAEAIERLSPEHRTVTVLHYLEGYSIEEIAELLNAPTGTVKSRLMYARRHLKALLHEDIEGDAKEGQP